MAVMELWSVVVLCHFSDKELNTKDELSTFLKTWFRAARLHGLITRIITICTKTKD
jgi:hypothetical protein